MKYPICYLILCHNNLQNIQSLLEVLYSDDAYFVIHIDKKCKEDFSFLYVYQNVYIVPERVSITWGNITVVDAVLKLSEYALEKVPFAHNYCLLSGADYPMKSHDYIKSYLKVHEGVDFIMGTAFPSEETQWIEGGRRRLEAYVVFLNAHSNATIEPRRFTLENFKQFCKVLFVNYRCLPRALQIWMSYPKRRFPVNFQPYAGEMWWVLTKETLKDTIKWNNNHPEYYKYHLDSQIPDEMYINSIVCNLSHSVCHEIKRYISWEKKTDMSPRWLCAEDWELIKDCIENPEILFIRKVKDERILKLISDELK